MPIHGDGGQAPHEARHPVYGPDSMHDEDEAKRRQARASWPVRVHRLDDDEGLDDTTPEQRVGMMWELAVQAWALAGLPMPDYDRAHMPVRVLRRGCEDVS